MYISGQVGVKPSDGLPIMGFEDLPAKGKRFFSQSFLLFELSYLAPTAAQTYWIMDNMKTLSRSRRFPGQRRKVLDDVNAIAAYAREMKDFLEESELTERRAFIETFVKEILVVPGDALMRYTVPMPDDSMAPGKATEKVALPGAVLSTVHDGGPSGTVLQALARVPRVIALGNFQVCRPRYRRVSSDFRA